MSDKKVYDPRARQHQKHRTAQPHDGIPAPQPPPQGKFRPTHRSSEYRQPPLRHEPNRRGGVSGSTRATNYSQARTMPKKQEFNWMAGVWEYVGWAINAIGVLFLVFIIISGVLVINLMDVAAGAISLNQIFKHSVDLEWFTLYPVDMALSFSIGTSFLQIVFWTMVSLWWRKNEAFSETDMPLGSWVILIIGIVANIVIILMDTTIDMSSTDYIVNGTSPENYAFFSHTFIRQVVDIMYGFLCAFGEMATSQAVFLVKALQDDEEGK